MPEKNLFVTGWQKKYVCCLEKTQAETIFAHLLAESLHVREPLPNEEGKIYWIFDRIPGKHSSEITANLNTFESIQSSD